MAREFPSRGNRVLGISRREAEDFQKEEGYRHLRLDLTDFDAVEDQLPGFLKDTPILDLVVLNAGVLGEIRWMKEVGVEEISGANRRNWLAVYLQSL